MICTNLDLDQCSLYIGRTVLDQYWIKSSCQRWYVSNFEPIQCRKVWALPFIGSLGLTLRRRTTGEVSRPCGFSLPALRADIGAANGPSYAGPHPDKPLHGTGLKSSHPVQIRTNPWGSPYQHARGSWQGCDIADPPSRGVNLSRTSFSWGRGSLVVNLTQGAIKANTGQKIRAGDL